MVIAAILPLAGLDSGNLPEPLGTLLEDVNRETIAGWAWLPSFGKHLGVSRPRPAAGERYDRDRHSLLDGGREVEDDIAEAFVQALHDDAAYGFLVEATRAVGRWRDGQVVYRWERTETSLHYGRTPERAIAAALDWGTAAAAAERGTGDSPAT